MRVVVIRFSSLGDCVLLCPFLEHLKSHGAGEVTVVTRQAYAELFSAARGVDRIIALGEHGGWRGLAQIIRSLRGHKYVVVDAHNSLRSRALVRALGGAAARIDKFYRARLGLVLFKRRADVPSVTRRYSALGERLGLPAVAPGPGGIEVPGPVAARMSTRLSGVPPDTVVVAPGSRWPMKRWGEEKFVELAHRIVHDHGRHVVLLGDTEDAEATERIASRLQHHATNLAGGTSILEAAAVLQRSVAFVGNDSGLMHLAEAVGVPVVALFGPTVEAFGYYPSLPASRVVERDIPCRPCSRNGSRRCPLGTQECLTAIPVEPVERAFVEVLENRRSAHRVVS